MHKPHLLLTLVFVLLCCSKTQAQFFFERSIGESLQINQFRGPDDVAVDASGNIFIVDGTSNQIKKFDATGAPLLQWGFGGSNNGQFNIPNSAALDASGNVYVVDVFNSKIQKFSNAGTFISKLGSGFYASGDGQFAWPSGVALDNSGNIYVADSHNHRIQKFNSAGTFITKWGTRGSADGQFEYPQAIAVDASGNVYVVDTNNHRIQKFNSSGTFLSKFGTGGQGDGQLNFPQGIAVDASGNVYVSDTYNNRIQKFNILGIFVGKLGSYGTANGQFLTPKGIDIDAAGNIYVADRNSKRIQKFNSSFTFLTAVGSPSTDGQLNEPYGMAIDVTGNIYVADVYNHQIQKFNISGTFVTRWGTFGSGNGQLNFPQGVSIDVSGNVYVMDAGNNRVQKFSSTGAYITQWGTGGSGDKQFNDPHGIAVDGNNNVYVADKNNHRVQKFNSAGTLLTKWGSLGLGDGNFNGPEGIAIDASGNVYVTDGLNSRVQKFTSAGVFVSKWGSAGTENGQFQGPYGIAASSSGSIYVVDNSSRIQKFINTGVHQASYGNYGWANGTLRHPRGVATDIQGNVYITDSNHRIQKFSVLDIFSLSAANGIIGSSLTISGTGFSTVASENLVKFNNTTATVTSTNPTSLTVTVPAGATTGKVSVTRGGYTVQSINEFLVLPLTVTSFTPAAGIVGTSVNIIGTGFSSVNGNNSVTFNGVTATVTAVPASTSTSITTTVPVGATTGKISITVASQAATSVSDFIVTKLGISQTNYPEFFIVDESGANVAILVNDINEIQSIKINRRGITEEDSKLKVDAIPFTTSGNTVSLSVPASYFTDPLGLYCWFSITEKAGNDIPSQPGNIYLKYPASSNKQVIPDLTSGKKTSAYQVIAIPLQLTTKSTKDVFADLGSYDNKKWRLYSLTNEKLGENPLTMETGKGYWFIMRDQTEINPGAGTVVKASKQIPYEMSLSSGWNLIGNPYNFSISWDDVLDHNGLTEEKLKLRQFLNGGFVADPLLKRFRGGFVESDIARVIEIPVINKSQSGGRKSAQDPTALDADTWHVNLNLQENEFSNSLLGFGMNPQAAEGKDSWDETTLPLLTGLSSATFSFRELNGKTLSKDIVPKQSNYSWIAKLSNTNDVTLTWRNTYFGENDKQLILELSSRVELTDMRKSHQITIPPGNHVLTFHFGSDGYVKEQVLEEEIRIGQIFPNPINRHHGLLQLPISLPSGENFVKASLHDIYGSKMEYAIDKLNGGRQLLGLKFEMKHMEPGLYILKVEIYNSRMGSQARFIKIMLE
ncbi:MAG: IPT/TIG domain-containing protein [Cyclobacteriaceae bacterium]|nr:IPT/TIG domain-containing protein [Cyclobacteriaceae bacterium]